MATMETMTLMKSATKPSTTLSAVLV